MKKQNAIFVFVILAVCSAIFAFKANENQDQASVVLVRAFIIPNGNLSKIQIYRGEARVEEVKLANLRADSQELNWQMITTTLNKLRTEGYHLVSCSINGDVSINSTYVFSK